MNKIVSVVYGTRWLLLSAGILLLFLSTAVRPFGPYPLPRKDAMGYYWINPQTKDKHYSDDAREVYRRCRLSDLGSAIGFGALLLVAAVSLVVKVSKTRETNNRKEGISEP